MPQSKTCLVIAIDKHNTRGTYEFYPFGKDFISVDRRWPEEPLCFLVLLPMMVSFLYLRWLKNSAVSYLVHAPVNFFTPIIQHMMRQAWKCMDHLPYRSYIRDGTRYSQTVVGCRLLWLDGHRGSTIIAFDDERGVYFAIDLVYEGLIHVCKCLCCFPRLLHVGNDELVLVWFDDSVYKLKRIGEERNHFAASFVADFI
ncbi:hypothetical protein OROHE_003916 [Orobanche hederae]